MAAKKQTTAPKLAGRWLPADHPYDLEATLEVLQSQLEHLTCWMRAEDGLRAYVDRTGQIRHIVTEDRERNLSCSCLRGSGNTCGVIIMLLAARAHVGVDAQ